MNDIIKAEIVEEYNQKVKIKFSDLSQKDKDDFINFFIQENTVVYI